MAPAWLKNLSMSGPSHYRRCPSGGPGWRSCRPGLPTRKWRRVVRNMTFTIGWRRSQGYRDWVSATTPVLWNEQTGEVIPLKDITQAPAGTWWLRRRVTLPVSSHPLFLTVPVQIGRTRHAQRAVKGVLVFLRGSHVSEHNLLRNGNGPSGLSELQSWTRGVF